VSDVARIHDELLFLRAYPPTERALRRAESLLSRFARRMKNVDPLLDPDVSGIAGTEVDMVFSYDFVRWLSRRFPRQVDIDWEEAPDGDRLAAVLTPLIPMLAEEVVDAHAPYFETLRHCGGLPWLLDRVDALQYDSLGLWIRWKFGAMHSRTRMRRRSAPIFYRRGPLLARRDVSIERELASPPMKIRTLTRREGEQALELMRTALATRYRELYAFTFGDPSTIVSADAGRGLEILLCGVLPEHRLPLRAAFAPFVFRNGVPIGYGDAFALCEHIDVSFNIFPAFREGESAYAFARLLKLYRQLFGSTAFSVDPYQIGRGNEEAIEAGAFWFYRKLGFRSTDPATERLALREEARIAKDPRHRTPARMLRRLAQSPMAYGGREWDRFRIHKLVERGFQLPRDLARAKRARSERGYLRLTAKIRGAVLA
jgi:hypothetical protein